MGRPGTKSWGISQSVISAISYASSAATRASLTMTSQTEIVPGFDVTLLIRSVRERRVILDSDLAGIYGVQTRALVQAVKRNADRFPKDFLFQLTPAEAAALRSQIVISKPGRGGRRYLPFVFTEHGALMAATVLNSPHAVAMSLYVKRLLVTDHVLQRFSSRVPNNVGEDLCSFLLCL